MAHHKQQQQFDVSSVVRGIAGLSGIVAEGCRYGCYPVVRYPSYYNQHVLSLNPITTRCRHVGHHSAVASSQPYSAAQT